MKSLHINLPEWNHPWLAKVIIRLLSGRGTGNRYFRIFVMRSPSFEVMLEKIRWGYASLMVPTFSMSWRITVFVILK